MDILHLLKPLSYPVKTNKNCSRIYLHIINGIQLHFGKGKTGFFELRRRGKDQKGSRPAVLANLSQWSQLSLRETRMYCRASGMCSLHISA